MVAEKLEGALREVDGPVTRDLVEDLLGASRMSYTGHQNGQGLRLRAWIGEERKARNGNEIERGRKREKRLV